ncbi:FecCD family ABC transporter permease [Pseudooceanicola nanhaiensis]|uniref:FecCD family ABC transporter permease n=1 Tax=Pseudooceanicola nanhaiensis TaxID=375761 RepID=UPI001CD281F9|nr:iron ABC transporter permease [Pseudooceanicola nanhaiensis]MCA0919410.1 iron ABC transporter permease [Pseudooceanicola nanhaiensis]
MSRSLTLRTPVLSLRLRVAALRTAALLLVLLAGIALWGTMRGDYPLTMAQIAGAFGADPDPMAEFIVTGLRLPRIAGALIAGAGFGLAGALFQTLSRNDLASPDLIGFSAGAALGAVASVVLLGATGLAAAGGAVAGVALTALVITALAWRDGLQPLRFVLVGVGIGLMLYAAVDYLLTRATGMEAEAAYRWLAGSLNAVGPSELTLGLPVITALLVAAALLERGMARLALGAEVATSLGLPLTRLRAAAALIGVLATALAVYVAGPVAFVAFVSGPVARRLAGGGPALLLSALLGATFLTAADLAARLAFAPTQLPVGIFTALCGAPVLIWQIRRQGRGPARKDAS